MAAQKAIKERYDQYICVPEMIGYIIEKGTFNQSENISNKIK